MVCLYQARSCPQTKRELYFLESWKSFFRDSYSFLELKFRNSLGDMTISSELWA